MVSAISLALITTSIALQRAEESYHQTSLAGAKIQADLAALSAAQILQTSPSLANSPVQIGRSTVRFSPTDSPDRLLVQVHATQNLTSRLILSYSYRLLRDSDKAIHSVILEGIYE
jgi:hypothetical protein